MSCNCASQEQIKKLHELYGEKVNPSIPTTLKFKIKRFLNAVGVYVAMIPIFPILIIFVFYKRFNKKNRSISIKKFISFLGVKTIDTALVKNIIENTNITK